MAKKPGIPQGFMPKFSMSIILFVIWFSFIIMLRVSYSQKLEPTQSFAVNLAMFMLFAAILVFIWGSWASEKGYIMSEEAKPKRKVKRRR